MSVRRDGALAGVVLVATAVAIVVVDAPISLLWAAIGGLGTVGFEFLATRRRTAVRRRWEQSGVQAVSVALALVAVVLGTRFAPSIVLSAVSGALVMYFLVLGCVAGYRGLENG